MIGPRELAGGLQFPEPPVALDDGSVLVGEIARGTVSRVTRDGRVPIEGGVTVVSPGGDRVEHVPLPDPLTTNLCFGGSALRTA